MNKVLMVCGLLFFMVAERSIAADSVDVYFVYKPTANPAIVYLPGEFNNWANNSSGNISPDPRWNMTKDLPSGTWYKRVRLQVGGAPGGRVPGAYQYKFNEGGCSSCWLNDPLNQHINVADNSNSFVVVKDPTIYHLLPNQRHPLVSTGTPLISAYVFPKVGGAVDTSLLSLTIDGTVYTGIGEYYNSATQQLSFLPPALPDGGHTVILNAGTNADTVTFTTQGGFARLLNESPFTTWKANWVLNGLVDDTSAVSATIVRNGTDTFPVPVVNRNISAGIPLIEGPNVFTLIADSAGTAKVSSPVTFVRKVNHRPNAMITLGGYIDSLNQVRLNAGTSTDPDSNQTAALTFLWSADPDNPEVVPGIDGATDEHLIFTPPRTPGEYYVRLIAADPGGNRDTTRNYFVVRNDGFAYYPDSTSLPAWAQKARVYFLYPKAASSAGTINASALLLPSIRDLGFNVIWMMPVMKNASPIDNNYGTGYNIVDFYSVAPEYGTNQDFGNFVSQAHALGLKVILDVTPNHTSRFHPWSADAHTFKRNSPYWNWYQHQPIPNSDNGLGQSVDADSFWYYSGYSDQLLNFNWTDLDARTEMTNVYLWWIKEFGIDGYRFDSYWGPHLRYGEQYMGRPVRDALRHLKPDILLLAETDGTGPGTETNYADYSGGGGAGGVDAAYDFKLYHNEIPGFYTNGTNTFTLQGDIDNAGYYPGPNALYMRFMESQDEDRIVYFYSGSPAWSLDATTTFRRTMPMASVIFTAPGFPMLWNGQEVGWGYGINGSKEARARSVINWNYQGRSLLAPHYQKLASIRGQFPAFTQHKRDTNHDGAVTSADTTDFVPLVTNTGIYSFLRPYPDQNGLVLVNFTSSGTGVTVNMGDKLKFRGGLQDSSIYYLNDVYGNRRDTVRGWMLKSDLLLSVAAYGTRIITVSTTQDSVVIPNPILAVDPIDPVFPREFRLGQNFPNPFNPQTTIQYSLGKGGFVTLKVYDILGRLVTTPVREFQEPGEHVVELNGSTLPSGMYFYRLSASGRSEVKKMLLLR